MHKTKGKPWKSEVEISLSRQENQSAEKSNWKIMKRIEGHLGRDLCVDGSLVVVELERLSDWHLVDRELTLYALQSEWEAKKNANIENLSQSYTNALASFGSAHRGASAFTEEELMLAERHAAVR